ncbi:MAG TPA: hypothetical protein V6D26_28910 [Stenomitos sp.]
MTQTLLWKNVQNLYEPKLRDARLRFATISHISDILAPNIEPAFLELFLIHFHALGVGMVEPVEGWICRTGKRSEKMGIPELSRYCQIHEKQETNHHLLMIQDTFTLVNHWNDRYSATLDINQLLAQPMTPGVQMYRRLHEDVIASDAPYSHLAIAYEIELLAIDHGRYLLEQCTRVLGSTLAKSLSFLQLHVDLDVGHTQFNTNQLEQLLDRHPDYASSLIHAGTAALDAYAMFVNECLQFSKSIQNI